MADFPEAIRPVLGDADRREPIARIIVTCVARIACGGKTGAGLRGCFSEYNQKYILQ